MTAFDRWEKPTQDQVEAALFKVRDLLEAGWVQRQAHAVINGVDCYCIQGAVAEVCGTIRLTHPIMWNGELSIPGRVVPGAWLRDAVTAALMAALPPYTATLAIFNDVGNRRQSEVVLLVNTAVGILRRAVAA